MSKKFLSNKLLQVDLKDFTGIRDYILLSKWFKSENVPLKITKRNYYTNTQRLLTNLLRDKDHEDTLIKALSHISKANFKQVLESIVTLHFNNKPKEMHEIIQKLMRLKKNPQIIEGISDLNGSVIENTNESLNILTEHFRAKYDDLGSKLRFTNTEPPNIILSKDDFDNIISKINKRKGNGYDYLPLTILNTPDGKEFILSVVNDIFKQSHPELLVFSTRLMLLSKTGSKYPKVNEIRPIAITTLPQKILEHVLLDRLETEFGQTISKAQFGFRPRLETLMHVLRLVDRLKSIRESKPKRFEHCLVFVDFTAAFDSIDHRLLLNKIESLPNCTNETLNLLKWYLNSIHLQLEEEMIHQNRGSPQGGVASPFIWLLYINDLLLEIEEVVGVINTFAFWHER